MTNTTPTLIVLMEDENIHTNTIPWCDDPTCPCKDDMQLWEEHIALPMRDGILTSDEAKRLFGGQQV